MIDAENIAYCVTRLECLNENGSTSVGTGFIFSIHADGGTHVPLLVTNRHVIANATQVRFLLTKKDPNGQPIMSDYQAVTISGRSLWKNHPDDHVDLCAMIFGHILNEFTNKLKTEIKWSRIAPSNIPNQEQFATMNAVEDVVMVGYPIGLWDSHNNRPIFRKGITATKPGLPYNGRKEFLIDIAAFPGSSGSPVFLYKEGFSVVNTAGDRLAGRDDRFFFIGVLYAGPMYNAEGEIEIQNVPTSTDPKIMFRIPTNLGIVISSEVLMEFESVFPAPVSVPGPSGV